jgi:hypothetical protein
MGMSKTSEVFLGFEELFQQLISSGIPTYLEARDYPLYFYKEDPSEPQVLSIEDLSFGFIVWLIACCVSTLVFVLEIFHKFISVNFKIFARKVIGLLIVLRWIRNRM